jgi:hypothetical protein
MTAFPRGGAPGRRPVRRSALLLVPTAAALLLGAACAGSAGQDRAAASHDEPQTVEASDLLAGADMATLTQVSDTVVRGTVVDVATRVRIDDSRVRYATLTVEVDEVLAGAAGDRVEVALTSHVGRQPVELEGRPMPEVGDEAVWYLTAVAPEFGYDGYRLTSGSGLLLLQDDGAVGGGIPGESPIAEEVERLDSPEAVVDRVREAAG